MYFLLFFFFFVKKYTHKNHFNPKGLSRELNCLTMNYRFDEITFFHCINSSENLTFH